MVEPMDRSCCYPRNAVYTARIDIFDNLFPVYLNADVATVDEISLPVDLDDVLDDVDHLTSITVYLDSASDQEVVV